MPLTVLAAAGEPQYNSDVQNKPASKAARKPVQKRPTYSIEAVDNALQLLQLLRLPLLRHRWNKPRLLQIQQEILKNPRLMRLHPRP